MHLFSVHPKIGFLGAYAVRRSISNFQNDSKIYDDETEVALE